VRRLADVRRVVESAPSVSVLVVGDVMLDAYVSGDASRISPEAPVPVVAVLNRRYLPGGAANVAANIRAMGSRVILAGVTGSDEGCLKLVRELEEAGIVRALVEDPERITTVKTRITAGGQQIVRFDEENTSPISAATAHELKKRCRDALQVADACVISDYAKGVLSESFCRWLIGEAANQKKPVVVDPKSRDFGRYRGATVITPNLKETASASGDLVHNSDELNRAVAHLLGGIAPSALLVTRGGEGMSLFEQGNTVWQLPALAVEVSDVTGAGDTVAGMLAIALALGLSLRDAAGLANLAAGLAVRHPGTWAVQPQELLDAAEHFGREAG
jgi:rfaE bifunctional protein kinase chain/domain